MCENAGSTCVNDADSPRGPGTTTCRQAYRTQKLLAVDQRGEVVVDSFPLPSACLCHFRTDPPFGLRNSGLGELPPQVNLPRCETREEHLGMSKVKNYY